MVDESKRNQNRSGGAKLKGFSTFSSSRDGEEIDPQEYARLLDFYDNSFRNIAEGEVVKGTVLKVTASEVIVDVGYKSEGIIAVDEFIDSALGALTHRKLEFDKTQSQLAGERIRELRKGVHLELNGKSIRELAHTGHKY